MIDTLITSHMRVKLLKKFFLNSNTAAHLRGLESEFGDSTNAIRVELNRFEEAGLLESFYDGNKKVFRANIEHPLYSDIHNIILKETGIDKVIEYIVNGIDNLLYVYLTGDFAFGREGKVVELIIVGDNIDIDSLTTRVYQAERIIGREIRFLLLCSKDADTKLINFKPCELLPLWTKEVVSWGKQY